jgi:hypothetical protein
MTLHLTSGGIDKGARPICDGRYVEAENDREGIIGKAGSRKAGKETDGEAAIALSSPFDRVVENIASMLSLGGMLKFEVSIFLALSRSSSSQTRDQEKNPCHHFLDSTTTTSDENSIS